MGGGSKGQTTSTSSNAPPPQVMAEYEQIMSRANQVAGQPYQPYTGNMVAGFTPDQQAAFQSVQGAQGTAQPYFDQARGLATAGSTPLPAADINQYYNPYQTNVIDATQKQFNLLNAQQQAQLTGSALGSGGLFNDRFGWRKENSADNKRRERHPFSPGWRRRALLKRRLSPSSKNRPNSKALIRSATSAPQTCRTSYRVRRRSSAPGANSSNMDKSC